MSFLTWRNLVYVLSVCTVRGVTWFVLKPGRCLLYLRANMDWLIWHAVSRWPALHLCVLLAHRGWRMQRLGNHTNIYNLNNLPPLPTLAELHFWIIHTKCCNMDMPVHLTLPAPSLSNTFHCFLHPPQSYAPSLSMHVTLYLSIIIRLWKEDNELIFFWLKKALCM